VLSLKSQQKKIRSVEIQNTPEMEATRLTTTEGGTTGYMKISVLGCDALRLL
jgi:hypothetical protein